MFYLKVKALELIVNKVIEDYLSAGLIIDELK